MTGVLTISCGIFRAELRALDGMSARRDPIFLSSMLHMRPDMLEARIDAVLRREAPTKVLFVYGDCTPRVTELCRTPGFAKTPGINCCEIMLGTAEYRMRRKQGAFFFLPEWTLRWREVFERELGFGRGAAAGEMLREVHTHFLYLDTGVLPVPREELAAIEAELGLPMDIVSIGLGPLRAHVSTALDLLHG